MKNDTSKQAETKQAPAQTEQYFFSGGGEYEPISIEAGSIQEATKKWEQMRTPIRGEELSVEN